MAKVVFISYSHDSDEHKGWVKKFAQDLASLGDFEILLDQDLPKGFSLTRFMEKGLVEADKVLIIGTPQYKLKSETGRGVAFEETIISTELMQDIDSTKFYPILRSGTFETSFPIALQGRGGDDLSNDEEYYDKLLIVAESIMNEKPIPSALLRKPKQEAPSKQPVAIVYLSQEIMFETYWGRPSGVIEGVAVSVLVTNNTKEIRFFNQPFFKLSVPFEGSVDSFYMLNVVQSVPFPAKLEYGEQFRVTYRFVPANINMFKALLVKDPKATMKAVVTTTLNETSESTPYEIVEFVKNSNFVH